METLVHALSAGAAAFATAGATAAGRDLYDRLTQAVRGRVGSAADEAEIDTALSLLEERPDSTPRQAVVGELLDDAGAGDDRELLELAERLLDALGAAGSGRDVHQSATGRNVVQQVGDGRAAIVDRSRNRR